MIFQFIMTLLVISLFIMVLQFFRKKYYLGRIKLFLALIFILLLFIFCFVKYVLPLGLFISLIILFLFYFILIYYLLNLFDKINKNKLGIMIGYYGSYFIKFFFFFYSLYSIGLMILLCFKHINFDFSILVENLNKVSPVVMLMLFYFGLIYALSLLIIRMIYLIKNNIYIKNENLKKILIRIRRIKEKLKSIKSIIPNSKIKDNYNFVVIITAFFLLFIFLYSIYNSLEKDYINYIPVMLSVFSLLFVPFMAMWSSIKMKKAPMHNMEVSFLNLDAFDIIEYGFYTFHSKPISPKSGRFFKFDLGEVFADSSIQILNYEKLFFGKDPERCQDKQKFYLFIEDINQKSSFLIKIQTSNDKYYTRIDLCINFKKVGDEIIYTDYNVYNYYVRKKEMNVHMMRFEYNLLPFFYRLYQYNENIVLTENELEVDNRKWLVHKGHFGSGKSALDTLIVSNAGVLPVVISPWEEKYDNDDIVYLIFKHLIKESKIKFIKPTQSVFLFFLATVITLSVFMKSILTYLCNILVMDGFINIIFGKLTTILEFFNPEKVNEKLLVFLLNQDNYTIIGFIGWFISVFVAIVFASYFLPAIIIHSKNTMKAHQDYYLKGIAKILEREKIMMILEDIDLFENDSRNMIFRLASSINKACANLTRAIGILSYEYPNEDVNRVDIETLENKVVYREIVKNYNENVSKHKYFKMCIYVMLAVQSQFDYYNKEECIRKIKKNYSYTISIIEDSENMPRMKEVNFRKIHDILSELELFIKQGKTDNEIANIVKELFKKELSSK